MKSNIVKTLVVLSFAFAGAAQAAPAGQYAANDQNVSLSQLYPGAYQAAATQAKSRDEVSAELAAQQNALHTGKFASDSEGASVAALYPASEAAPKLATTLTRAQVREAYQQARASGELRDVDNGLSDREIFPQQYAAGRAARVQ